MKKIRIGKSPECELKVSDATVSRNHAQLTINDDGTFVLEDLGSTNGTKVNGVFIKRSKVTASDRIELGCNGYHLNLSSLIPAKTDYSTEFQKLKSVYEKYAEEKVTIDKSITQKSMLTRSLPMTFPGLITLLIGIVSSASYKPLLTTIGAVLSVIIPLISIGASSKQMARKPELMQKLNDQFNVDYVCPKCKNFLGYISWESLYNKGICPSCKAKWSKPKN